MANNHDEWEGEYDHETGKIELRRKESEPNLLLLAIFTAIIKGCATVINAFRKNPKLRKGLRIVLITFLVVCIIYLPIGMYFVIYDLTRVNVLDFSVIESENVTIEDGTDYTYMDGYGKELEYPLFEFCSYIIDGESVKAYVDIKIDGKYKYLDISALWRGGFSENKVTLSIYADDELVYTSGERSKGDDESEQKIFIDNAENIRIETTCNYAKESGRSYATYVFVEALVHK